MDPVKFVKQYYNKLITHLQLTIEKDKLILGVVLQHDNKIDLMLKFQKICIALKTFKYASNMIIC